MAKGFVFGRPCLGDAIEDFSLHPWARRPSHLELELGEGLAGKRKWAQTTMIPPESQHILLRSGRVLLQAKHEQTSSHSEGGETTLGCWGVRLISTRMGSSSSSYNNCHRGQKGRIILRPTPQARAFSCSQAALGWGLMSSGDHQHLSSGQVGSFVYNLSPDMRRDPTCHLQRLCCCYRGPFCKKQKKRRARKPSCPKACFRRKHQPDTPPCLSYCETATSRLVSSQLTNYCLEPPFG